ncbi:MAG TPA: hypothetical protein ENN20_08025 [Candidatus Marinimicrobia bacterium]|nr:hypothetical protein [Candidatus Neomarinimicrobiota bacterium]
MKKNLFIVGIFIFSFCGKPGEPVDYLARVNNEYLTPDYIKTVYSEITADYTNNSDYMKSIVSNWVKNEILYQQAMKYRFDKDKSIQYKVENYQKQLIIDAYIRLLLQTNIHVSEDEIRNFYIQNRSSYLRDVDEAKVSHLIIDDFDEANRIKNILRSRNRKDIDQLFSNYRFETKVVRRGESIKELDKNIFESPPRNILGPIPSDYGYHIIEVISRYKARTIRSIDDVRNEILDKITQAKIQDYYNANLDSLLSITDYEIKHENINTRTFFP